MPSLSSLMALLPSGASGAPTGSSPVSPDLLRSYLRSQPAYKVNRERAAVIIREGLGIYDAWATAKPIIFIGGLVGMALSGAAIYRRRQSAKEAMVLYSGTFLVSALAAWVARPISPPANAPPGYGGAIAAIDEKRAALTAEDPNWADETYQELAEMPGIEQDLDANPLLKAVVL